MGRTYKQFSLEERCASARLRADGQSIRQIAATLGRAASSVSREVRRGGGNAAASYKPVYADELRWARRWRGSRLVRQPDLYTLVMNKLVMGWSPEQIAGRLTLEHSALSISHESIYRFIYAQIARTKDYKWRHYLPRAKSKRGWGRRPHKPMDHIKDRVSLDKRPAYIDKRRQYGHWETDLIMLSDKKHNLLVAQERLSRYTFIAKQNGKAAQPTVDRLRNWLAPLPAPLRRTLTQDNGPEFFLHHQLNPLGIATYFCNPHSPWQKGGVENMNGRIRRYIPLKTKPESLSDDDVQCLANNLNDTPRKCLGFKTPSEVFSKQFQLLHLECESTIPPSRG
jgi:IS30 family transposase